MIQINTEKVLISESGDLSSDIVTIEASRIGSSGLCIPPGYHEPCCETVMVVSMLASELYHKVNKIARTRDMAFLRCYCCSCMLAAMPDSVPFLWRRHQVSPSQWLKFLNYTGAESVSPLPVDLKYLSGILKLG